MGHTIYFQSYLNKKQYLTPVNSILECFTPFIHSKDDSGFDLIFDDNSSSHVFIEHKKESVFAFSLDRPCGHINEYQCFYKAVQLGYFISYEPGSPFIYYFKEETPDHIPDEEKESMLEFGGFKFIKNIEEFINR